ncbi:aminodeoxychorismate/anthranilate synthase component II [Pontibacillus sp. HMF3514]|uniref:anthranilate synthase component II n=1 Tax=Pontibacillus sp. HMF3514 TaxID=2692425 RepID=UPI00131FE4E0|nr:aminodeoxychorismate/anthranilate synthase component II [Pontibacillus sp. HMF3514]QHE51096.1 anthranilate/aminodeoxychorismate synthase component II [Pontibacillus sp. HMF3514]
MIIMIDNYDSFTYNLVQYIGELGLEVVVRKNDQISIKEMESLQPEAIVISPGPCTPNEAGVSLEVVKHFAGKIPILGVCLGHQVIVQALGGSIGRVEQLYHGKASRMIHDGKSIYHQLPNPLQAGRYHSLIAKGEEVPKSLEVTARDSAGEVMGVRHRDFAIEGIQFHPESILTEHGKQMLINFMDFYRIGPETRVG